MCSSDLLGITYFEIGMYSQAEDAFAHAVALDGNDGSKSEVRRAVLDEEDENAKTKFVEPPPGQNDPPKPPA